MNIKRLWQDATILVALLFLKMKNNFVLCDALRLKNFSSICLRHITSNYWLHLDADSLLWSSWEAHGETFCTSNKSSFSYTAVVKGLSCDRANCLKQSPLCNWLEQCFFIDLYTQKTHCNCCWKGEQSPWLGRGRYFCFIQDWWLVLGCLQPRAVCLDAYGTK